MLINVTGGTDVTLHEVDAAASRICKQVDEEATIIFGTSLDQKMDGHMARCGDRHRHRFG